MSADLTRPPDAFMELSSSFHQGPFDAGVPSEPEIIRSALEFVGEADKRGAREFIAQLLASGAGNDELLRIWRESGAQIYVEGDIRPWYEAILAAL